MDSKFFRKIAYILLRGLSCGTALPNSDITYFYVTTAGGTIISDVNFGTVGSGASITLVTVLFHDTVIDSHNTWFNDLTKAYVTNTSAVLQIKISNLFPIISTAQLDELSTKIAAFIKSWIGFVTLDYATKLHFIGHGQGAHIAGKTARKLVESITPGSGNRILRLTALNPGSFTQFAGKFSPELKLQKSDAKFVDVIHTECIVFGSCDVLGDADFYPNGALVQPGCTIVNPICSHDRATKYFIDSILTANSQSYESKQCESYSLFERGLCLSNAEASMGMAVTIVATGAFLPKGKYYLKTKSDAPYGLN